MNNSEGEKTNQAGILPEERFYRIFQQYYRRVEGFFLRNGFSKEESGELVQETFLRVFRNLEGFRGESSFDTWLFEVAAGVYRNELRRGSTLKRDAVQVSLDEDSPDEQNDPLNDLLSGERQKVLQEALADLPPQMRRCVELRVYQDLKYREIAEVMMVSIDTVKAHLFQARRLLKTKLSDYFSQYL
jgi:RNA polymerase sigma-70 factor (ECF subfamily)